MYVHRALSCHCRQQVLISTLMNSKKKKWPRNHHHDCAPISLFRTETRITIPGRTRGRQLVRTHFPMEPTRCRFPNSSEFIGANIVSVSDTEETRKRQKRSGTWRRKRKRPTSSSTQMRRELVPFAIESGRRIGRSASTQTPTSTSTTRRSFPPRYLHTFSSCALLLPFLSPPLPPTSRSPSLYSLVVEIPVIRLASQRNIGENMFRCP